MASFFEEIWNSIFTPGTTPTLLLATNVTFAALQVVLFTLLLATSSIHFVILSFICGGLWAAINWFATELKKEQAKEAERKAQEEAKARQNADDSDDTEVEAVDSKTKSSVAPVSASHEIEVTEQQGELKQRLDTSPGYKSGVSTEDEWEKVSENETEKDK
ncbi:putative V-type ATPase assembly factor pkr1 [Seiridium unicorne]|uniref:V-type ATPase assembly factor pkr1 n=1 Tax=Seiridium unicorne TaxID=138068 RepID=A0ABR2V354_9PEZI